MSEPDSSRLRAARRSTRTSFIQKHRLENILGKAPKEVRDELKAAILESANSYEQGLKKGREVIARYRQRS